MKSKINTEIYSFEGSPGVLSIRRPDWNMTGEYTCFVQTFESTDKRSSRLQIIGKIFKTYPIDRIQQKEKIIILFMYIKI